MSAGVAEIRDPLHGPIRVSRGELAVIDTPAFQRLRRIKQLGFGELTFPGATHTRYLHSLGAMHLAGVAFSAAIEDLPPIPPRTLTRLRAIVRLAALLHDIGHTPLSHQLEHLLPPRAELGLPDWVEAAPRGAPSQHEHLSLLLLVGDRLSETIDHAFGDIGIGTDDVAAVLFDGSDAATAATFTIHGRSILPLMQQLVSGELDCDRMDYLRRDAYFAGVSYGKYDQAWILSNLTAVELEGCYGLGLGARAVQTFEDFLLARYHMFTIVYAHHRTLAYDRMLRSFLEETGALNRLPADPEAYLEYDDGTIWDLLKRHRENRWAARILERRPLPLALELDEARDGIEAGAIAEVLSARGIEHFRVDVHTPMSTYDPRQPLHKVSTPPLQIVSRDRVLHPGARPVSEATDLYARYRETPQIVRFYVAERDLPAFTALNLGGRLGRPPVPQ